ncbi:MAG: DarT ssDNA thymidine ADP-ribosyltransferase family protein, partial [Gammaproteobacteria bacterium]|nr:DarT ssDNA thymidine ADP-ribosyltransferase family protein [Gammaproteobacteria bacterium]
MAAATERGITQVVHFTTVRGVTGVLASCAVKSRKRLPEEHYLEHVFQPNAEFRKDASWLDYVNLSISRINDWMFDSSVRWHGHEDNPWVVLVLDVELLGDPGVVFATTN